MPFRFVPPGRSRTSDRDRIALRSDGQTAITVGTDASFSLERRPKSDPTIHLHRAPSGALVLCGDGRTVAGGASDGTISSGGTRTEARRVGRRLPTVGTSRRWSHYPRATRPRRRRDRHPHHRCQQRVSIGTIPDTKQSWRSRDAAPVRLPHRPQATPWSPVRSIESVRRLSVPVPTSSKRGHRNAAMVRRSRGQARPSTY